MVCALKTQYDFVEIETDCISHVVMLHNELNFRSKHDLPFRDNCMVQHNHMVFIGSTESDTDT